MKKLLLFAIFGSLLAGCDKVEKPLEHYVAPVIPRRKVLLEDYTGHKCGNCPRAAEDIVKMEEKYHDELVVISVHAGDFANTDKNFPASYTTTPGNDWNTTFIGLAGAYPCGAINRKTLDGQIIQPRTKWPSLVDQAFNDEYIVDLSITPSYDQISRQLNVAVKGNFKKAYSKSLFVTVVLTEDSLYGPQVDYAKGTQPNYLFVHMLRDAVNGSWGTPFTDKAMSAKDSITVSFSNFPVKSEFNAGRLSVVAFVFDPETKEVVEVEKVKMTGKPVN